MLFKVNDKPSVEAFVMEIRYYKLLKEVFDKMIITNLRVFPINIKNEYVFEIVDGKLTIPRVGCCCGLFSRNLIKNIK